MKVSFTNFSLVFLITMFFGISLNAQTTKGLERVIVEKYYVSNQNDADASEGKLPVGSVTWRIYLDLLPGYKFKAAYGNEAHPLSITTKTSFFNNEDRGSTTPGFSKTNAKKNTVMLDSWLSAGAACASNFGVQKSVDDGVATVVNADGILQNADPSAGIPLTVQDGLIQIKDTLPDGTLIDILPGQCGFIGLEGAIDVFDATSQSGNNFSVTGGSWYCLEGAMGADSTKNRVLIAQLTTDGELFFKLNVTIGTPEGNTEYYVSDNPGIIPGAGTDIITEILDTTLTFLSSKYIPTAIVNNFIAKKEISVYPNPTRNICYIALPSDFSEGIYTIYNMAGNSIVSKNISSNTEKVDLSNYPNGIYFVKVQSNGNNSTFKVIKKE
jgi:hypothetical protein